LFAQDPLAAEHAEADAFFCFSQLMVDMRDAFVKTLDYELTGTHGRIEQLDSLLRQKDEEVWRHLENQKVTPLYYTLRWLTLLLTQELEMPDVLRIWDAILGDIARLPGYKLRTPFLHYICVAMVLAVREELLAGDFTDCLRILQRLTSHRLFQIDEVLRVAHKLRAEDIVPEGFSNVDVASGKSSRLPEQQQQQGGEDLAVWQVFHASVTGAVAGMDVENLQSSVQSGLSNLGGWLRSGSSGLLNSGNSNSSQRRWRNSSSATSGAAASSSASSFGGAGGAGGVPRPPERQPPMTKGG